MTVTVKKIEKPKPATNPLAFDLDTQPGELVMCVSGNDALTKGEVYTFSAHDGNDYLSVKEMPNTLLFTFRFANVHRLPDGTLAFGRGPAVTKPEKTYTTDEVRNSPLGSLFESTDPKAVYTHARRIICAVIVSHRNGETALSDHGLSGETWRLLSTTHNVEITYEEEA
jgi:hypothetical protein